MSTSGMKTSPENVQSTHVFMMSGDTPTLPAEALFELKELSVMPHVPVKCMMDKAIQATPELLESTPKPQVPEYASPKPRPVPMVQQRQDEEAIEYADAIAIPCTQSEPKVEASCETKESADTVDTFVLEREEEESCGMMCLSYTVQCCDCTVL